MQPKILIVDDKRANLQLLREVLKGEGYKLLFAKGGKAALAQVEKHSPLDLILLDIIMPEMDGYEVCRQLKARPQTKYIPIIFVTAKNSEEDEAKGLELGVVDYITKPVRDAIVRARVKTHLVLSAQRVTLENTNRELKTLQREQQGFFGMAVHDLRSPLTAILGNIPFIFMEEEFPLKKRKEQLAAIERNAQKMKKLTDEILELQKLKSGKMVFQQEPVDLPDLIITVVKDNQGYAASLGVHLRAGTLPAVQILGDRTYLGRVLTNLLTNALKYSPEEATVVIEASLQEGNRARISVLDHGPGIPEEFQPRIFDAFSQAKNQKKGGTGLGMTLCQLATEGMGGTIGFDTSIGEGTTFWVEFSTSA